MFTLFCNELETKFVHTVHATIHFQYHTIQVNHVCLIWPKNTPPKDECLLHWFSGTHMLHSAQEMCVVCIKLAHGNRTAVCVWSKSEVPNPWAVDRYRSVGHLVPGRTEKINNLHYFRFIYYLSLNDVLFWKMTRLSVTSVYDSLLTHVKTLVSVTWYATLKGRSVKILSDIKSTGLWRKEGWGPLI